MTKDYQDKDERDKMGGGTIRGLEEGSLTQEMFERDIQEPSFINFIYTNI